MVSFFDRVLEFNFAYDNNSYFYAFSKLMERFFLKMRGKAKKKDGNNAALFVKNKTIAAYLRFISTFNFAFSLSRTTFIASCTFCPFKRFSMNAFTCSKGTSFAFSLPFTLMIW